MSAETQHQPTAPKDGFDLNEVFVECDDPLNVEIPSGADRLMPPPLSVQKKLKDLGEKKQWGKQYSWQPQEKRATLEEMGGRVNTDTAETYRTLMKRWLCERHNMRKDVDENWMMVREGVRKTYEDIMDLFDKDGTSGRFILITPTFSNIVSAAVTNRDGTPRRKGHDFLPMDSTNGWHLPENLEATLEEKLQKDDLLVLCNPNNPNGYVYSKEDLQTIMSVCKRKGVRIISDDIWSDQIFDPKKKPHTPIINVALEQDYAPGVILLYSTGKAFNTEAIPCSIAVIPDEKLQRQLEKLDASRKSEEQDAPTQLGAELAIGAINPEDGDGAAYMERLNRQLKENMEYVSKEMEKLDCTVHPSESSSVLFVKLPPQTILDQQNDVSARVASTLNREARKREHLLTLMGDPEIGMGYIPGIEYEQHVPREQRNEPEQIKQLAMNSDCIRVNIGVPLPVLREKFARIKQKLQKQE